jgi:acetolactate synthase small subunit
VDAINGQVTFELAADSARVDALLEILEPHGLTEIVRSGPLAMRRRA